MARAGSARPPVALSWALSMAFLLLAVLLAVHFSQEPHTVDGTAVAQVVSVEAVSRTERPLLARVSWTDAEGREVVSRLDVSDYDDVEVGQDLPVSILSGGGVAPNPMPSSLSRFGVAILAFVASLVWFIVALVSSRAGRVRNARNG